jgi:hypothetical protein
MTTQYYITKEETRIVRELCRAAHIDWHTIAARPMVAEHWVSCYREADRDVEKALDAIEATADWGMKKV